MRKVIFWIHLTAGIVAGAVILLMSATGVLLMYEKQMVAWSDRSDAALPPMPSVPRLPVDQIVEAASKAAGGGAVTNLNISSVPGAPALATVDAKVFAVNPYSGAVLGEASPRLRAFFRSVTSWHRWLAVEGPAREITRGITGWSNLLFLIIVIGGPFLWLPKKWTVTQFRAVGLFRGGLRGKARDFNWHNVIGIWSFVPLFLIVLGALPISFQWANAATYRIVGEQPPAQAGGRGQAEGRRGGGAPRDGGRQNAARSAAPVLEPLWAKAEQQVEGWRTIGARIGGNPNAPLAFTIDRGTGGQPQLRGTLTLDRKTAEVVRWETYDQQTTGRQLRTFFRFAHTGEYFGIVGQTIAGLASAGAVVLVWTGIALALRRFNAWRSRRRNPAAAGAVTQTNAA